ncbi:2-oxo acid dehydrogenase subunit E2 [Puteibacter caeruleilacunae]|nr:2-oxo acid dehydrogenase subunit E2 [Puteibacter caeruleilacunae]
MGYVFNFPDIGEGLEEGIIAEWYVKIGSEVETGDPLVKMETDKVVTDIPSPRTGIVTKTYGKVGEVIEVGSPLVEINIAGEEEVKQEEVLEEEGAGVVGVIEVAGKDDVMPVSDEVVTSTKKVEESGRRKVLATPVARALAKDLEVDITLIAGTGPGGRVMKDDIRNFQSNMNGKQTDSNSKALSIEVSKDLDELGEVEVVQMSQVRKTIARNMIHSKQNAAHMSLFDEAEVSELVALRDKIKGKYQEQGVKISYLHFLLKAIALTLKKFPSLNSVMNMDEGTITLKKYYNLGLAVDAPQGLVVPVLKNVDQLSIVQISQQSNDIARRAREGKLSMNDLKGGTFSVTNFGSIGGRFAVPVINYPQAAILGAGKIYKKPVVKNNVVLPGVVMPLSISVDHRIVDGGEVTRFMNDIIEYLENPYLLLVE